MDNKCLFIMKINLNSVSGGENIVSELMADQDGMLCMVEGVDDSYDYELLGKCKNWI